MILILCISVLNKYVNTPWMGVNVLEGEKKQLPNCIVNNNFVMHTLSAYDYQVIIHYLSKHFDNTQFSFHEDLKKACK